MKRIEQTMPTLLCLASPSISSLRPYRTSTALEPLPGQGMPLDWNMAENQAKLWIWKKNAFRKSKLLKSLWIPQCIFRQSVTGTVTVMGYVFKQLWEWQAFKAALLQESRGGALYLPCDSYHLRCVAKINTPWPWPWPWPLCMSPLCFGVSVLF
jgi:hypothetical protein